MKALILAIATSIALTAPSWAVVHSDATPRPDYTGTMTITYHPVMCLVPPCPPGHYSITADGAVLAEGDVVLIERGSSRTRHHDAYIKPDTVTGELWVGGQERRDVNSARILPGTLIVKLAAPQSDARNSPTRAPRTFFVGWRTN